MANNYVVQTVVQNLATDSLDITGTVNGVPVSAHANLSSISPSALASAIAFETLAAALMLASYNLITAPTAIPSLQGLAFSR